MGFVYEKITHKNAGDVTNARRGIIKEPETRQTTITAMVDTGAATLVITEAVRRQLGLEVIGERFATLANNTREIFKITEPVDVHWNNRSAAVRALVVSGGGGDVLLGVIPLEDMDLMVDPIQQMLVGVHGDEPVAIIK